MLHSKQKVAWKESPECDFSQIRPTKFNQLGDVHVSLNYNLSKHKLNVVIIECRGLKKMDVIGLSDPYVKAYLMIGNKRLEKRKTSTKMKTLNPTFNETLTFDISQEKLKKAHLLITVVDYDRVGSNEPIGQVHIGYEADDEDAARQWADTLDKPGRTFVEWHSMQELKTAKK